MIKVKVKKYAVTISTIVEVPEDLRINKTVTRRLLKANDSGIREGIESQFDDSAIIRGDMKVTLQEIL